MSAVRLAALAFGVIAGLVASLTLALGGLDVAVLHGVDPRQLSFIRFGLLIIANFGMLGAGVVLAAPLAGAILLIVGAIAWLAAALVLRHGPDFVLLTPLALLLIAAGFAIVAHLRSPQRRSTDRDYAQDDEDELADLPELPELPRGGALPLAEPLPFNEETDYDEPPATRVSAGFFGQGGTATPVRVEAGRPPQPALRSDGSDLNREPVSDNWRPGSRQPPPRLKPMFRQPDDEYDDDEETGWSRLARGISSVLSFGLYAGLAGAAILVFWNLRSGDRSPAAAKIEAPASVAALPSSAPAGPEPVAPVLTSAPSLPMPSSAAELPAASAEPANLITAAPALNDTALVAPPPVANAAEAASRLQPQGELDIAPSPAAEAPSPDLFPGTVVAPPAPEPDAAPVADSPAEPAAPVDAAAQPMPFEMPAEIAAQRAGGKPPRRAPVAAAPSPGNDTGM